MIVKFLTQWLERGVKLSELTVNPSEVEGEVIAKPSKSYTHRFFSIGLLADGVSKIRNPLLSLDTESTLEAVKILGGEVEVTEPGVKIIGTGGELDPKSNKINVGNSGTTLRLMSAISTLSSKKIQLTGDQSILKRPMGPLINSLNDLGSNAECKGNKGRPPVVVGGGLVGGETIITGSVSSQFISALLFASPYSQVGVDLEVEEGLKSKPYVRITLETLRLASADVQASSSLMSYKIPGEQVFESIDCTVPGDFSSAAFILAAGAMSDRGVKVTNLDPDDVQGDKRIINLLKEFGAEVEVGESHVKAVGKEKLNGIDADCSNNPDLVPILTVLGAMSEETTRLYNVKHLRYKEVDRLKALTTELGKLGVEIEEKEDGLKIRGNGKISGGEVNSYGDHRTAMALTIAGLFAEGQVKISNAESVNISYPGFVKDIQKIGASVESEED